MSISTNFPRSSSFTGLSRAILLLFCSSAKSNPPALEIIDSFNPPLDSESSSWMPESLGVVSSSRLATLLVMTAAAAAPTGLTSSSSLSQLAIAPLLLLLLPFPRRSSGFSGFKTATSILNGVENHQNPTNSPKMARFSRPSENREGIDFSPLPKP
uniref:(northern house mosquito) hypothetical protein n=1 Tax=Culex pipiens TaxID=7175 RepID=A0A8D8I0Z7_CULPI